MFRCASDEPYDSVVRGTGEWNPYRRAVITAVVLAALLPGCAAQSPTPPVNCQLSCVEMWTGCKGSCQRAIDPTGKIRGSQDTCERVCTVKRQTCEVACLKGEEPTF